MTTVKNGTDYLDFAGKIRQKECEKRDDYGEFIVKIRRTVQQCLTERILGLRQAREFAEAVRILPVTPTGTWETMEDSWVNANGERVDHFDEVYGYEVYRVVDRNGRLERVS